MTDDCRFVLLLIIHPQGVRKEDPKTKQPILYDIEDKINFAVFPGLQVSRRAHTMQGHWPTLAQTTCGLS